MQGLPHEDAIMEQMLAWLDRPSPREQRHFLETHPDLLSPESDTILQALLAQEADQIKSGQKFRDALFLLQDIRGRGEKGGAIREGYVNLYGGFALDLPPWLEEIEVQLTVLKQAKEPEQTAEERVAMLDKALQRAQKEKDLAPEILATLRYELASALWRRHKHSSLLEAGITLCEQVLDNYTLTHYPQQYAQTQSVLGNIYRICIKGNKRENLEQAIAYFQNALRIHICEVFPSEYAQIQNYLGLTYWERTDGERRENLELAIACYQAALRVWTLETFPGGYARLQNNLGNAYWQRVMGDRCENLELAIVCFQNALYVFTQEVFSQGYATIQMNLGCVYRERIVGERGENLEQAITCLQESLRIWTLELFPYDYALSYINLGAVYRIRLAGEQRENLEQAIACYRKALQVWTLEAFPEGYTRLQNNLGYVYRERPIGERSENLKQAIFSFREAVNVWTLDVFPSDYRLTQLNIAKTEALRGNWNAVHKAYQASLAAEELLISLGTGVAGYDAVLKEGQNAAIHDGYALTRLGRVDEAAVAIERGRARGLAEAVIFDAADPAHIGDEARRARYVEARQALVAAQADLHAPLPAELDEEAQRRLDLARIAAYRAAKESFDALVAEIRAAHDPADFFHATLDAQAIVQAAEQAGPGHTLVYLAATPWGGIAVAAFSGHLREDEHIAPHFAALDLPDLNEAFVASLIETRWQDGSERFWGGFALAQQGEGFEQVLRQWEGETFQARASALHADCHKAQQSSTLDMAAQETLARDPIPQLAEQRLATLSQQDRALLGATFDQIFLQHELRRCLDSLSKTALAPVISWVQEQGATSLTLIPCGYLAAFPLTTVVLPDGRLVGETIATSIAPSARSLLHHDHTNITRAGVYALGDPQHNLPWSEAEVLTLKALARQQQMPAVAEVQQTATRERLLTALHTGIIVDASCHGSFDTHDFLRSALRLAAGERVTMAEMLSHQADLRGLRLLMLSACQTAMLDLQGARDEVRSLAAAMLQAGARAVLAAHWAVDDRATYLLMVRFAQEWFPRMDQETPAAALARAQSWLRSITNAELTTWQATMPKIAGWKHPTKQTIPPASTGLPEASVSTSGVTRWQRMAVRGRNMRYAKSEAQFIVRIGAIEQDSAACPYADPYYWAGFQVIGW